MIENLFILLKANKQFIHINILVNELKTSKEDVLYCISSLKNMGYNIIQNQNSEFLLDYTYEDMFNPLEINFHLKTNFIAKKNKFMFFDSIDSTNTFAKNLCYIDQQLHGTTVVSNNQINGKGRFGRTWVSQKDTNIAVSLILVPKFSIHQISIFNLILPIAICRAIENYTQLKTNIKWFNDIIINNKKIGGILTESISQEGELQFVIVGVGINVNNYLFPDNLMKKATSLKLEANKTFNRSIILANILYEIENIYYEYIKTLSFHPFINDYRNLCLNIGKDVKVIINNKEIYGEILDINNKGELIFITNIGKKLYLKSGEVSLRNTNGDYI